jgi:hypothetical protein
MKLRTLKSQDATIREVGGPSEDIAVHIRQVRLHEAAGHLGAAYRILKDTKDDQLAHEVAVVYHKIAREI